MNDQSYEAGYVALFDTASGKDHLSIVANIVRIMSKGERWTLGRVMRFVSVMQNGRPADSWLTHQSLVQCWLCGLVRSRLPSGETNEELAEWVKL